MLPQLYRRGENGDSQHASPKRVMSQGANSRTQLPCPHLLPGGFSSFQLAIIGSTHNISSPWLCRRVNSAWWKGQKLGWGGGGVWVLVLRKVMACAKTCGVWGSALLNQGIFHTHHSPPPPNIVRSWKHLLPLSWRGSTANAACNVNGQGTNRLVCVHTSFKTQSVSPLWET